MIMADKYDNNSSYNSGDFKRNANQGTGAENGPGQHQDGEVGVKLNQKADEYMRELLAEKIKLNDAKFPLSAKLIDAEITRVKTTGRGPARDNKYLDVLNEKPAKVTVKVLVPVKENPKFNFVGKILGPKGNTMKQLQEETMCRMAVLGKGSMRDRQKEEELRNSLDPKYGHLTDELHVEISALAPPAEAYARLALALTEVKKHLIPDPGPDMMWQPPMAGRPMGPGGRGPPRGPPRMPPPPLGRTPAKKPMGMDNSYGYEDPYGHSEPMRGPPRAADSEFYYDRAPERFYEDEPYYKDERSEYKTSSARDVGTRRPPTGPQRHSPYARQQPYGRSNNSRGRPANKASSGGGWA